MRFKSVSIQRDTAIAIYNAIQAVAAKFGFGIASFRQPFRRCDFRVVRKLRSECEMLLTPLEAQQIACCVSATSKLGGEMAEVGVYRGASAKLIRVTDEMRPLHLFDTFSGLPPTDSEDTMHRWGGFKEGEFSCSLEYVQHYLADQPRIHFHPGLFPETGSAVNGARFSFVHLDVDIYKSTHDALEFFYPRMLPGGIIMSHDFVGCAGPHKAISNFFAGKPDPVIELPGDQCAIVKTV